MARTILNVGDLVEFNGCIYEVFPGPVLVTPMVTGAWEEKEPVEGELIFFDEFDGLWENGKSQPSGLIHSVNRDTGFVMVTIPGREYTIYFELDGGLWDTTGMFKRVTWGWCPSV